MPTITMPEFGIQGLPENTKDNVRVDFKTKDFEKIIEVKGYRLAWSRASMCPCAGVNDQTQQVDPNCTVCKGVGWLYFGPKDYVADTEVLGELTVTQKLALPNSAVIKGLMSGLSTNFQAFTEVGHWMSGTSMLTVRPENRIGYYDKLVGLDSEIVYAETLDAGPVGDLLTARYPVLSVNYLRSLDTVYSDVDFELDTGKIKWRVGREPAEGTKLAVHYQTYPTWLVIEHPHTVRDTLIKRKTRTPLTPLGTPKHLPLQAVVRYDFLQG